MEQEVVTIKLPFSGELLNHLFSEFCWAREDISLPHPETTGNCSGHPKPRGFDNGDSGEYQNAAYYCGHCYHSSNPARITWNENTITVEACPASTKPFRALVVYRQVVQPTVGVFMPTPVEELRDLSLVRFPDETYA